MKKILYLSAGLLFCAFTVTNAVHAASVANAKAGEALTIDAGNVTGAQDLVFTPSTNVWINGGVEATSFAITAWHDQAIKKASGQAYGMAADSNKMLFQDISQTAPAAMTGTNLADFGNTWHTM